MSGRLFLAGSLLVALVAFAGALIAGARWAGEFRAADGDSARYDELLDEALERLEKGDANGSKRLTERVLALDPQDPIARANLGRIYKGQGDYARAIAEHKLALAVAPELPDLYYNIACYYALSKRTEDAFLWLARAMEKGFGRKARISGDPDLESLRDDPRFALLERAGRLPTGVPRVRLNASRMAIAGGSFEVSVVVERDVEANQAASAAAELEVAWSPVEPLTVVSSRIETRAFPEDGIVRLRTEGIWEVRAPEEGLFALPAATATYAGGTVRSGSASVEVLAERPPEERPRRSPDDPPGDPQPGEDASP